jgi:hypothetical protein
MKEAATTEAEATPHGCVSRRNSLKSEGRGMFLASYSHAVAIFGIDFFFPSRTWYPFSTLVMGELCAILTELEKKFVKRGEARLLASLTPAASGNTARCRLRQLCSPQTTAKSMQYEKSSTHASSHHGHSMCFRELLNAAKCLSAVGYDLCVMAVVMIVA